MKKKNKLMLLIVAAVVVIAGGIGIVAWYNAQPGTYDDFARCITDKKATFYGAFWCPHCQNQKHEFGRSARLLPYVECSTPDGQGTNEICQQKNVTSYPTWIFADGSTQVGEMSLDDLATKTGCALPK